VCSEEKLHGAAVVTMPLFMTDSEFEKEHVNVDAIVSKADAFIKGLQEQVETHKARADATAINAEQTCALIERKFLILSGQFSQLENEKEQSFVTLERRSTELAQAQGQIHKLEIEAVCLFRLFTPECLVYFGPISGVETWCFMTFIVIIEFGMTCVP